MIKRLQGGVEGDDDYPQWFLVDKLNEVIDELNDLEERYAQHTGYPAELMHPKSPPKEEDTPKEAANELEELKEMVEDVLVGYGGGAMPSTTLDVATDAIMHLISKQRQEARVRASLEALQDFKRYMDLTSQHAFEATYSVLCKRIGDIEYELKELESKEEA